MTPNWTFSSPDVSRTVYMKAMYDICKDGSTSQRFCRPFLAEIMHIIVRFVHVGKLFHAGCRNIIFSVCVRFQFYVYCHHTHHGCTVSRWRVNAE